MKYTTTAIFIIGVIFTQSSCAQNFHDSIVYQKLMNLKEIEGHKILTYEIKYLSDGLVITGYISKPEKGKYPVLIYNRGGNKDLGTHGARSVGYQRELASNEFIVLSTQLRGNFFSQGEDEFGGKDLNDILQLIEISKVLKFADAKNIGVLGWSRGGLNTYQISRLTDDIKAIAVIGAPTDPRLDFGTRPEMYTKVYLPLVGDSITHVKEYDYRSPLKWADEINEPVLILHGSEDWRVTPQNAERIIEKFKENGTELEYHIIEGGNHSLSSHSDFCTRTIITWFNKYLK